MTLAGVESTTIRPHPSLDHALVRSERGRVVNIMIKVTSVEMHYAPALHLFLKVEEKFH